MTEQLNEYISVSDYAAFTGKTTSTVYNQINNGDLPCVTFSRGSMQGKLVPKPMGYDEWKAKQTV